MLTQAVIQARSGRPVDSATQPALKNSQQAAVHSHRLLSQIFYPNGDTGSHILGSQTKSTTLPDANTLYAGRVRKNA